MARTYRCVWCRREVEFSTWPRDWPAHVVHRLNELEALMPCADGCEGVPLVTDEED